MFDGKNLVAEHTSAKNKYVNKMMRILFTENELNKGYIIEDAKSSSKRTPLDLNKIKILKGN